MSMHLVPPMTPDETPVMADLVEQTIAALPYDERDAALCGLARTYARVMDSSYGDPAVIQSIGNQLQRALVELGATPRRRGDSGSADVPSRLAVFRERAAARVDGA